MQLHIINSDSTGNSYLLEDSHGDCLLLEAGCKFKDGVKKHIKFKEVNMLGAFITHEHGDHSKYVKDYLFNGIIVYMSQGTKNALKLDHELLKILPESIKLGNFTINRFETFHDCNEPIGFYINHSESGNIVFATDTAFLPYKFENINHILVECNNSEKKLLENVNNGNVNKSLALRIQNTHFSVEKLSEFLLKNDCRFVNNLLLLHLSKQNSNKEYFLDILSRVFKGLILIAEKKITIELNINPF